MLQCGTATRGHEVESVRCALRGWGGATGRPKREPDCTQWLGPAVAASCDSRACGEIGSRCVLWRIRIEPCTRCCFVNVPVVMRGCTCAVGGFLLEAHGTGTSLGDPIEARAMSAVRDEPQLMAVAGCKANFGHTEPAAGLTGMLQLAQALQDITIASNAQLRAVNPHVRSSMQERRQPTLLVQLGRLHAVHRLPR